LKRKRAALVERLQQIATEQIEIQELMGALDRAILSYETDCQPSSTPEIPAVTEFVLDAFKC